MKTKSEMTQPKVRHFIDWLKNCDFNGMNVPSYDAASMELLDELFLLVDKINPTYENGARSLWFHANRGSIQDYGDANELIADGEIDSKEEFQKMWEEEFPDEVEWYEFTALQLEREKYRAVSLRHQIVIVQDERRTASSFPYDISEFVQWLVDSMKECVMMLEAGTYNDFIDQHLPPQHRTGTIRRKDFWHVWPEAKTDFFKEISQDDVAEFCALAYDQPENLSAISGLLHVMTANDFYRFCALGYAANNYKGTNRTPKEQYYLNADGRDDGLKEIEPDSPEAFEKWLIDRKQFGGHPWEVCRGGNSTHVSLYVHHDDNGYSLVLAGDAWNRTIETVKFFLALRHAGLPVYLQEAKTLADRLTGKEKIGIVPEGVLPAYCEGRFPSEHIIDFMNLPTEDREKFLPFCEWQRIKPVCLSSGKEQSRDI